MPREKEIHEIEVHVAGLCLEEREDSLYVLIGKRAANRNLFPDFWECGGGQVHRNETFTEAVKRQMNEEFGLEVDVMFPFRSYSIKTENKIIPGVGFVCVPRGGQKIQIDNVELVDHKWVTPKDMKDYATIPGLCEDVQIGIEMYLKLHKVKNPPHKR
ncbi:MAG: NUDIX domain-containing protein [Alphaproteobacteria bacterium]|nr:NUDIX domain-containing protein [Alphaproteobacteria bacterium]